MTDRAAGPGDDELGERAGVLEYDGGYPRSEAERLARAELSGVRPVGRPDGRVSKVNKNRDA